MAKAKKDFSRGADRFFSANDDRQQSTTDTTNTTNTTDTANTTDTTNTADTANTTNTTNTRSTRRRSNGAYERMSIGLAGEVMQYLRAMSAISGTSVAGYLEHLARRDMETNGEVYERLRGLKENVR